MYQLFSCARHVAQIAKDDRIGVGTIRDRLRGIWFRLALATGSSEASLRYRDRRVVFDAYPAPS
jgi:hypothetical protein